MLCAQTAPQTWLTIRTPASGLRCVQIPAQGTVADLKAWIAARNAVAPESQRLVLNRHRALDRDETPIVELGLRPTDVLDVLVRCPGGANEIDPSRAELARKTNCERKICRHCYARLSVRATSCRKRKCGHSANLRMKKKLKD